MELPIEAYARVASPGRPRAFGFFFESDDPIFVIRLDHPERRGRRQGPAGRHRDLALRAR
jgi:hypothetical protein